MRILSSDNVQPENRLRMGRTVQRTLKTKPLKLNEKNNRKMKGIQYPVDWSLLIHDPIIPDSYLTRVAAGQDQVLVEFGKGDGGQTGITVK